MHKSSIFSALLFCLPTFAGPAGRNIRTMALLRRRSWAHTLCALAADRRVQFSDLKLAWIFKTDNFGPNPEYRFQSTPLMVDGVLYTTAGSRRSVVALDATNGEILWSFRFAEGLRATNAPRQLSGRGLAFWQGSNGQNSRVLYVTPGYQLIALDAFTGNLVPEFGRNGVVDLKQNLDQVIDLNTADIGLHATPIVAKDVVIVGAAHRTGGNPRSRKNVKGFVRGSMSKQANVYGFSTPYLGVVSTATNLGKKTPKLHRQHRRMGTNIS